MDWSFPEPQSALRPIVQHGIVPLHLHAVGAGWTFATRALSRLGLCLMPKDHSIT